MVQKASKNSVQSVAFRVLMTLASVMTLFLLSISQAMAATTPVQYFVPQNSTYPFVTAVLVDDSGNQYPVKSPANRLSFKKLVLIGNELYYEIDNGSTVATGAPDKAYIRQTEINPSFSASTPVANPVTITETIPKTEPGPHGDINYIFDTDVQFTSLPANMEGAKLISILPTNLNIDSFTKNYVKTSDGSDYYELNYNDQKGYVSVKSVSYLIGGANNYQPKVVTIHYGNAQLDVENNSLHDGVQGGFKLQQTFISRGTVTTPDNQTVYVINTLDNWEPTTLNLNDARTLYQASNYSGISKVTPIPEPAVTNESNSSSESSVSSEASVSSDMSQSSESSVVSSESTPSSESSVVSSESTPSSESSVVSSESAPSGESSVVSSESEPSSESSVVSSESKAQSSSVKASSLSTSQSKSETSSSKAANSSVPVSSKESTASSKASSSNKSISLKVSSTNTKTPTKAKNNLPKTGENNTPFLILGSLIVLAGVGIIIFKRKSNR